LLHAGTRPATLAGAAAAIALLALLLGWFDWYAPAFALLGVAWLTRRAAAILGRVHRARRTSRLPVWLRPAAVFDWALDAALATVAVWRSEAAAPQLLLTAGFAILVLLGLLRLVARVFARRRWAGWFEDRLVLALGLAGASTSAVFPLAVMFAGLGLLVFALAMSGDRSAGESGEVAGQAPPDRLTPP
jgi:hypothetical protein